MTRLVIDASALLSGIVGADPSPPARLVDALFDGHFESVVCPRLLGEVRRGLTQPYFLKRMIPPTPSARCARSRAQASSSAIRANQRASCAIPPTTTSSRSHWPAAHAIVTGDRDLLDHPGLNPPALNVRAACDLLGL